jgi:hypothetical protein
VIDAKTQITAGRDSLPSEAAAIRLRRSICLVSNCRRRSTIPAPAKPSSIRAHVAGSGMAGATTLPTKSIDTKVGRTFASVSAIPFKVPEAPSNLPVPPRMVNSHSASQIPGVPVGVEPPSKVPLKASCQKSMMKVPADVTPPSERQVLVP